MFNEYKTIFKKINHDAYTLLKYKSRLKVARIPIR